MKTLLIVCYFLNSIAFASSKLEVLGKIHQFEVSSSKELSFSYEKELKGKSWSAVFIFTRCQGSCPLLIKKFKKYADSFPSMDFVVFTVDPDYDKPDKMEQYAIQNKLNKKNNWHFLTAPKEYLNKLYKEQFLIGNTDGSHIEKVILVDKQGIIRGYYSLSEDFETLVDSSKALLKR